MGNSHSVKRMKESNTSRSSECLLTSTRLPFNLQKNWLVFRMVLPYLDIKSVAQIDATAPRLLTQSDWRVVFQNRYYRKLSVQNSKETVDWKLRVAKIFYEWAKTEVQYLEQSRVVENILTRYLLKYRNSCGFVGLLSNLISFDNVLVARALSIARQRATRVAVFTDMPSVLQFKKFVSESKISRPLNISYITLDLDYGNNANKHEITPVVPGSGNVPSGFIGYAINLIKLRPEHEYLRKAVLLTTFLKLMVFETFTDGNKFEEEIKKFNAKNEQKCFKNVWTTCLDVENFVAYYHKRYTNQRAFQEIKNMKLCGWSFASGSSSYNKFRPTLLERIDLVSKENTKKYWTVENFSRIQSTQNIIIEEISCRTQKRIQKLKKIYRLDSDSGCLAAHTK